MDALGGFLGGLGGVGLVVAIVLGFVVLCFLPWWAIVDHLSANRSGLSKVLGLIALVITWGVGSVVYGLFLARSRVLRVFTTIVVVCVSVVFVVSLTTLLTGAGIHGRHVAEERRRERDQVMAGFQPSPMPATGGSFYALHFTWAGPGPATAAVTRFGLLGPDFDSARNVDHSIRQIAYDVANDRYYALARSFGTISPSTGQFSTIEVDSSVGNSTWPTGIALDSNSGLIYMATESGATRFLTYDTRTAVWKLLPVEIPDLPLVSLAWLPSDGCLYGLEARSGDPALRRLHRFNRAGASLGPIDLHPPIPFSNGRDWPVQLLASDGKLVLVLPPVGLDTPATAGDVRTSPNRILVVDPTSGQVFAPSPAL